MKQLTKEQHDAIVAWLDWNAQLSPAAIDGFTLRFPPACCDSCAEGGVCESEKPKPTGSEMQPLYDGTVTATADNPLNVITTSDLKTH